MWLAQFVCAPQFFKTPKGLCGHTVFQTDVNIHKNLGIKNREANRMQSRNMTLQIVMNDLPYLLCSIKIVTLNNFTDKFIFGNKLNKFVQTETKRTSRQNAR
jgi:hypothetical protein